MWSQVFSCQWLGALWEEFSSSVAAVPHAPFVSVRFGLECKWAVTALVTGRQGSAHTVPHHLHQGAQFKA